MVAGTPLVVGVKKCDVFAASLGYAAVARRPHPGIILRDDAQHVEAVAGGVAAYYLRAVVGRTVVDHDDLAIMEILRHN